MNWKHFQSAGFLKHSDLTRPYQWLLIERAEGKTLPDGEVQPALCFKQYPDQWLGLNKTNRNTLFDLYGYEEADYPGKWLLVYRTVVDFQGKPVMAIRLNSIDGRGMRQACDLSQTPVMFDPSHAPQFLADAVPAPQQQPQQAPNRNRTSGYVVDITEQQAPQQQPQQAPQRPPAMPPQPQATPPQAVQEWIDVNAPKPPEATQPDSW